MLSLLTVHGQYFPVIPDAEMEDWVLSSLLNFNVYFIDRFCMKRFLNLFILIFKLVLQLKRFSNFLYYFKKIIRIVSKKKN